jgi:hypothetical protein
MGGPVVWEGRWSGKAGGLGGRALGGPAIWAAGEAHEDGARVPSRLGTAPPGTGTAETTRQVDDLVATTIAVRGPGLLDGPAIGVLDLGLGLDDLEG